MQAVVVTSSWQLPNQQTFERINLMSEYRNRSTGAVNSQGAIRQMYAQHIPASGMDC